jgi:DNA mismatch endonuclease Vsr
MPRQGKLVRKAKEDAAHRSWTMAQVKSKNTTPEMTVRKAAHALGLRFRLHRSDLSGKPDLVFSQWRTENAIVSQWAMRRHSQLRQSADLVAKELRLPRKKAARNNPDGRLKKIDDEINRLDSLSRKLAELEGTLSRLGNDVELLTGIYPGPIFQRDFRLRQLLRAFAPRFSEVLSAVESSRSHYPPIYLNTLWELWGAVWLANEFRSWGFTGTCFVNSVDMLKSCSWRFQRGEVVLELDYEAEPALIDNERIPPAHDRGMPALEWLRSTSSSTRIVPTSDRNCGVRRTI